MLYFTSVLRTSFLFPGAVTVIGFSVIISLTVCIITPRWKKKRRYIILVG